MIPLQLQLKNFLSYGTSVQTINFEPYHLICLSGKNGHGKSALLDALSWLVWGQARKCGSAPRADESLIRLGQSHMFVMGEFSVKNEIYKIRRELILQSNKTTTVLDFAVRDERTGLMRNLSEKTIRMTQEKICEIFGLDFETFSNSVFLRQGQSNEFSKKTPKERKDILTSILQLQRFETIKQKALDQIKTVTLQHEALSQQKKMLLEVSAQKSMLTQQYSALSSEITIKEQAQRCLTQQKNEIVDLISQHKEHIYKLEILLQKQEELRNDIKIANERFATDIKMWRSYLQRLRLQSVPQSYEDESVIISTIMLLEDHKKKSLELQEQRQKEMLALSENVFKRQRNLEQQLSLVEQKKTHVQLDLIREEDHLARLTVQLQELGAQLAQEQLRASEYDKYYILAQQEQAHLEKLQNFLIKVKTLLKRLEYRLEDATLEHKSSLTEGFCPLCAQIITPEYQAQLSASIFKKNNLLLYQRKRLIALESYYRKSLEIIQKRLAEYQNTLQEITQAQHAQVRLVKAHEQCAHEQQIIVQKIEHSKATLQHAEYEHTSIYTQLIQEQHHAAQEQKKLLANFEYQQCMLDLTIEHLSIAHKPLEYWYAQRAKMEEDKQTQRDLEYIKLQIVALRQNIQSQIQKLRDLKHEINQLEKTTVQLDHARSLLSQLQKQEQALQESHATIQHEVATLLVRKGSLEQQLFTCEQAEEKSKTVEQEMNALHQEVEDYQFIAKATSKDGIPALLIEQALPELEQEANYLLAKLTDNQTQLSIESLRDLKSGHTKETLDIKISDSLGIRSYDLFSGGEAFRIDLALRIGLSKLLARRSGTALQTLIIDEGFGSQDDEGLHRIMEALYKIQEDFAKIIIVSHLPHMKDQFPTHFVINKTPAGSTVQVMLQG